MILLLCLREFAKALLLKAAKIHDYLAKGITLLPPKENSTNSDRD